MTLNLLSGYIRLRARKLPILWTGEMAEHCAVNYFETPGLHPLLHLDAQKVAQHVKEWKKVSSGKTYLGYATLNGLSLVAYVVIHSKFAEIRTVYRKEAPMSKKSKISSKDTEVENLPQYFNDAQYEDMVKLGLHESKEEAIRFHAKFFDDIEKKKKRKKKK